MSTGSVTIAADGTVTKSGLAGTIYDAAVAVLAAKSPAVALPTGPDGVPTKTGIADLANTIAPAITGGGQPIGSWVGWPLNTNPSDTNWYIGSNRRSIF
jgi:hypothetical protein